MVVGVAMAAAVGTVIAGVGVGKVAAEGDGVWGVATGAQAPKRMVSTEAIPTSRVVLGTSHLYTPTSPQAHDLVNPTC